MNPETWKNRISASNKFYNEWASLFRCSKLENYYEGFHWNVQSTEYMPYVLNLVYSTIKIKLANILYQAPEFQVGAAPGKSNWDLEFAAITASLKQDVLNTVVKNPNSHFCHNAKLAALDSFARFGIMEVGYAADWFHPNFISPLDLVDKKELNREQEIPVNERVFFNHIKASRFRVSIDDATILDNTSWCGYYSFVNRTILESTPGVVFPSAYKPHYVAEDYPTLATHYGVSQSSPEFFSYLGRGEVCKVWTIWDNYNNEKMLLIDGIFEEIWKDTFERLPVKDLRWDLRAPSKDNVGWYPIPLIWQWLSPQDEINRAREQMRRYRRRFTRKFGYIKGAIDTEEIEKFSSDIDGATVEMKQANALFSIDNPDIGATIPIELQTSLADFDVMSGTSGPARGNAPDRETATASRIADTRESIRESVEQLDFSGFLCEVGREALLTFQERFTEGIWAKFTADPSEDFLGEIQNNAPNFQYIVTQDVEDGYDMDISINLVNSTPARMIEEEQKFIKFLTLVSQYPQIALSPIMIREAAYRVGYRNEKVIKEMQKTALLNMLGQGMNASGAGNIGSQAGAINANNTARQQGLGSSSEDDIRNQLASQLS